MVATPPPPPNTTVPPQSPLLSAWPRSVQVATAFLLGLATLVLGYRSFGYLWNSVSQADPPQVEKAAYLIDLNEADRAELLQLPGVGESLAQRILDYRSEHGGFQRVEDLRRVRGIGPATFDKLRPWVCVSEPEEESDESEPQAPRVRTIAGSERQSASSNPTATGRKLTKGDAPLDLNRATVEDLLRVPGIGPRLAEAIVAARAEKPFASVGELRRIKGVGPKTLEKLRPFVAVEARPNDKASGKE